MRFNDNKIIDREVENITNLFKYLKSKKAFDKLSGIKTKEIRDFLKYSKDKNYIFSKGEELGILSHFFDRKRGFLCHLKDRKSLSRKKLDGFFRKFENVLFRLFKKNNSIWLITKKEFGIKKYNEILNFFEGKISNLDLYNPLIKILNKKGFLKKWAG